MINDRNEDEMLVHLELLYGTTVSSHPPSLRTCPTASNRRQDSKVLLSTSADTAATLDDDSGFDPLLLLVDNDDDDDSKDEQHPQTEMAARWQIREFQMAAKNNQSQSHWDHLSRIVLQPHAAPTSRKGFGLI